MSNLEFVSFVVLKKCITLRAKTRSKIAYVLFSHLLVLVLTIDGHQGFLFRFYYVIMQFLERNFFPQKSLFVLIGNFLVKDFFLSDNEETGNC